MNDFFNEEESSAEASARRIAAYHAYPAFRQSLANELLQNSPRHAWDKANRVKGGVPEKDHTRDREIGNVTHSLVLGEGGRWKQINADDWKKKVDQDKRTECEIAGIVPILSADLPRARRAAGAVLTQLEDFGIRLDGRSEVELYWEEDGLKCKTLVDHVCEDMTALDIKTGESANPRDLVKRIIAQGYHVQAAAITRAMRANGMTPNRFIDVFAETAGLALVTPFEIGGSLLELGERSWLRACRVWKECQETGVYPGYVDGVITRPAPEWAIAAEDFAESGGDDEILGEVA